MTGCTFAAALASKARIAYQVVLNRFATSDTAAVAAFIDGAAADGKVAVLLFPRYRSARDVAVLASRLVTDARWDWARVRAGATPRPDVFMALSWTTPAGACSSAMGFAPIGTMPVTRRAPYVAIAVWGGGHENAHKKTRGPNVGFIDIRVDMSAPQHEAAWKGTMSAVDLLLEDPVDDAKALQHVAFCLPPAAVRGLGLPRGARRARRAGPTKT